MAQATKVDIDIGSFLETRQVFLLGERTRSKIEMGGSDDRLP